MYPLALSPTGATLDMSVLGMSDLGMFLEIDDAVCLSGGNGPIIVIDCDL